MDLLKEMYEDLSTSSSIHHASIFMKHLSRASDNIVQAQLHKSRFDMGKHHSSTTPGLLSPWTYERFRFAKKLFYRMLLEHGKRT